VNEELTDAVMILAGIAADTPAGEPELHRMLDIVVGPHNESTFLYFSDAIATELGVSQNGVGFDYRVKGGWVFDLSSAAVRSAISVALTTAGLAALGQSAAIVAAEVLVIVVPLLFDVQRVELSGGQMHIHLKLQEAFREHAQGHLPATELYALLPADVREQLAYHDFLDLLDQFTKAGLTTTDNENRMAILPADGAKMRITME